MPAPGEFGIARADVPLVDDLPDFFDPSGFLRLCSVPSLAVEQIGCRQAPQPCLSRNRSPRKSHGSVRHTAVSI